MPTRPPKLPTPSTRLTSQRASLLGRVIGWTLLLALVCAYAYAFWRYPAAVGVLSAGAVALTLWKTRRISRRLRTLARERRGESLSEFSRAFDGRQADPAVVRAVYEEIQRQLRWNYPDFPVRPTDRLIEDLHFDSGDIDLLLFDELAQRMDRSTRYTDDNPWYGRVETVQDLVAFLCAQERQR